MVRCNCARTIFSIIINHGWLHFRNLACLMYTLAKRCKEVASGVNMSCKVKPVYTPIRPRSDVKVTSHFNVALTKAQSLRYDIGRDRALVRANFNARELLQNSASPINEGGRSL